MVPDDQGANVSLFHALLREAEGDSFGCGQQIAPRPAVRFVPCAPVNDGFPLGGIFGMKLPPIPNTIAGRDVVKIAFQDRTPGYVMVFILPKRAAARIAVPGSHRVRGGAHR
jgi:hypothetical protein